jgi:hypothetical protein
MRYKLIDILDLSIIKFKLIAQNFEVFFPLLLTLNEIIY